MNYSSLFYWLVVADNARILFAWGAGIFSVLFIVISLIFLFGDWRGEEKEKATAKHFILWSAPAACLFWMLLILTPSKRDALLIVAGGQTMNFLTTDSSAKKLPSELSGFLVTEIKNMASEVNVDLKSNDAKARILEEAKSMTSDQLIQKMKADTTFSKVILNQ